MFYNNNFRIISEVLPLIEFKIEDGLSDEEAINCINAEPPVDADQINPFRTVNKNSVLKLRKDQLLSMDKNQIFISKFSPPLKTRYYYNMIAEINFSKCFACNKVSFNF